MQRNNLEEYHYDLPADRIPNKPLDDRSASKLLVYKEHRIKHSVFRNIPDYLPPRSLLFLNDTKVIPARIYMQKSTGAMIEIFLLKPVLPESEVTSAMLVRGRAVWHCMIGNKRKWKEHDTLTLEVPGTKSFQVHASYHNHETNEVELVWDASFTFSEMLESIGEMPLPPYMNRRATSEDKPRYQTVYSANEGAVAAPTAGLHFTDDILKRLQQHNHTLQYLTLHVSAGTFQPIKADKVEDHPMHFEQVEISRENLQAIIAQSGPVVAIGTTSLRTLESVYWYGVMLMKDKNAAFFIEKLYPYGHQSTLPDRKEVFQFILDRMEGDTLKGGTEIFIFPGYQFRVVDILVTNFHLPASTLLLLIAAFIGNDWKEVYRQALNNEYRFLSYGDSSILFKNEHINQKVQHS